MAKTLYVRPSNQYHYGPEAVGRVQFTIIPFEEGDPEFRKADGQGQPGMLVAQLKELFGGDEGEIVDPIKGQVHLVSLKPWATSDPTKTFLHFSFKFVSDD